MSKGVSWFPRRRRIRGRTAAQRGSLENACWRKGGFWNDYEPDNNSRSETTPAGWWRYAGVKGDICPVWTDQGQAGGYSTVLTPVQRTITKRTWTLWICSGTVASQGRRSLTAGAWGFEYSPWLPANTPPPPPTPPSFSLVAYRHSELFSWQGLKRIVHRHPHAHYDGGLHCKLYKGRTLCSSITSLLITSPCLT